MIRYPDARTSAAAGVLLAVSLAACLIFVNSYPLPGLISDDIGYLALARNVAAGAGFTQDGISPMVYRPPLFSVLLGGWFFLNGSSSILSAAVFQSILHALGVAAAFFLFLEISVPLSWALAGALFLAVNPLLVTRVVFVLQEPTLVLFTTLAVLASVRLVRSPSPGRAALAGAAWGVCTLGKVVAWFAPFLLLGMRLLPARLRRSLRAKEAAALMLCFAAAVAPWTIRNFVHFGRFIPVNNQGVGILEWNIVQAEPPGTISGKDLVAEADSKGWTGAVRHEAMWSYFRNNARYFLVDRVVRNAVHFAAPPRDWWIARGHFRPGEHRTSFWILSGLFHIPLYIFLLYRSAQWFAGRAPYLLGVPVLFYWVYWAEHALVWGDPRFGLAVYPVLVLMVLPFRTDLQERQDPFLLPGRTPGSA